MRVGRPERAVVLIVMAVLFGLAGMPGSASAVTPELDSLAAITIAEYTAYVPNITAELRPLHDQLSDLESAVRIRAVESLGLVGGDEAALLLVRAMFQDLERDPAVRMEAARSLGALGGRKALEVLGIGLTDRIEAVRRKSVQELRWAATVFAIPYIGISVTSDPSEGVRLEGVRMLRKIGTQFAVQHLADAMFSDRSTTIRRAAADAMGELGKKEIQVADYLGRAYQAEADASVRLEIVGSMGLVRDKAGLPYLAAAMNDRDTAVKLRATQVYGRVLGLQ